MLAILVAEAEKVIAYYKANTPSQLSQHQHRQSLPKDEYGAVWPEDDSECRLTLEDYLRLKYSEAEDE